VNRAADLGAQTRSVGYRAEGDADSVESAIPAPSADHDFFVQGRRVRRQPSTPARRQPETVVLQDDGADRSNVHP